MKNIETKPCVNTATIPTCLWKINKCQKFPTKKLKYGKFTKINQKLLIA